MAISASYSRVALERGDHEVELRVVDGAPEIEFERLAWTQDDAALEEQLVLQAGALRHVRAGVAVLHDVLRPAVHRARADPARRRDASIERPILDHPRVGGGDRPWEEGARLPSPVVLGRTPAGRVRK